MFFFNVGNKIFCFFKRMSLCNFWWGYISRGEWTSQVLRFRFFGGGGGGKKGWGPYFRVGLIPRRTLWWIFWKWFMKMLKKKTFILQQSYLYIRVLKSCEVLFYTYCKGLFCFYIAVVQLLCLCSSEYA